MTSGWTSVHRVSERCSRGCCSTSAVRCRWTDWPTTCGPEHRQRRPRPHSRRTSPTSDARSSPTARRAPPPDRPARAPARVLVTRAPGYALDLEPDRLDRHRFEADAAAAAEASAAERFDDAVTFADRALARWRGEPFADLDPELDHVADPERRRLVELRAAVREDRLAALVALGKHRHVVGELERFVADHPYRERAWELLVLSQYRSGRQVEALRAYQDARRTLVDDVGVEPGARLVELERAIIAQDPALDLPIRTPAPEVRDGSTAPIADDGFVGREREVAALRDRWRGDDGRRGGFFSVVGEAGIGKTRLVEVALAEVVAAGDVIVVRGRAVEGEFAPGYWPWTQALGALVASADDVAIARAGPALAHIVPDVAERMGIESPTGRDADTRADASGDPATRFAVQRAVATLLEQAASERPVIVVLDDLHWADASSVRLLGALLDDLGRLGVHVVVTYRPVEASQDPAVTDLLARAARSVGATRIVLHGLGVDDVIARFAAIGVQLDRRTAAVVRDRTGGNPLFLEELARLAAVRPGTEVTALLEDVPHGVVDIVRQRLARLSPDTVALVELASVAGRTSDLGVLAAALGTDVDRVLDHLEPAVVACVVEFDPERPGAVRFTHDLVRAAVESALPATRRIRAHRDLADSMVAHAGADPVAAMSIAQHYAAAMPLGTADRAYRWATTAARHASATGADDEAVVAWELAVRSHEVVAPNELAARFELLVDLAHARRRAWDVAGTVQVIEDAIGLADHLDDPVRAVEVASIPAEVTLWDWNLPGEHPAVLVSALERSLPRLPADAVATRIVGHGALGVALRYADPERAVEVSDRAVELATEHGDAALLVRALDNAYLSRWSRRVADRNRRIAARLVEVASRGGLDDDVVAIGVMFEAMNLHELGRIDEFADRVDRARRLRARVRRPDVAAQLDFVAASWAALVGDVDEARSLVERGWRTRFESSSMWGGEWTYALARSGIGDLGPEDYADLGDRLRPAAEAEGVDLVRPTAALMYLRAGRFDDARALVGDGPRVVDGWSWCCTLVQWAELAVELGLPIVAELERDLAPFADGFAVAGSNLAGWGSMHLHLGRLAAADGRRDDAVDHFRRALDAHRKHGFTALAARTESLLTSVG